MSLGKLKKRGSIYFTRKFSWLYNITLELNISNAGIHYILFVFNYVYKLKENKSKITYSFITSADCTLCIQNTIMNIIISLSSWCNQQNRRNLLRHLSLSETCYSKFAFLQRKPPQNLLGIITLSLLDLRSEFWMDKKQV